VEPGRVAAKKNRSEIPPGTSDPTAHLPLNRQENQLSSSDGLKAASMARSTGYCQPGQDGSPLRLEAVSETRKSRVLNDSPGSDVEVWYALAHGH